jgi:hypothetical protein
MLGYQEKPEKGKCKTPRNMKESLITSNPNKIQQKSRDPTFSFLFSSFSKQVATTKREKRS